MERTKKNPVIEKLTCGLQKDFQKFAVEIGYSEEQLTEFERVYSEPEVYRNVLLTRWYDTAGRHTTKENHIIYKALLAIELADLASTCFCGRVPDVHSEEILEDLFADVKKIDVPSAKSQEDTDLQLPVRSKKAKKKRKRKNGGVPVVHSEEILEDLFADVKKIDVLSATSQKDTDLQLPARSKKTKEKRKRKNEGVPDVHSEKILEDLFADVQKIDVPSATSQEDTDHQLPARSKKTIEKTKRKDEGVPDVHSEEILEDLFADVKKIDVPTATSQEDTDLELPVRSKKVKEKRKRKVEGVPDVHSEEILEDLFADVKKIDVPSATSQEDTDLQFPVRSKKAKEKRKRKDKGLQMVSEESEGIVMIGTYNTVTVNNFVQPLKTGCPEEDECLSILKDILDFTGDNFHGKRQMKLQSLETCFKQRKGKPFKEIKGISMIDFLRRSNSSLHLIQTKDQWFVHMNHGIKKEGVSATKVKGKIPTTEHTPESSKYLPDKIDSVSQNKTSMPKRKENVIPLKSTFVRPKREIKDLPFEPNKCSAFDDFFRKVGYFQENEYILMIPKIDHTKHENALANIPWLCVFDFDSESHANGLYHRVEETFRKHRNLMTCTWKDQPNITACGTEWCFVSGSTHDPESTTPHRNCKQWYVKVQQHLTEHIKGIANHLDTVLPLTVVLFWPEDTVTGFQFEKVISCINCQIRPLPQVAVIGNPPGKHEIIIDQIDPDYFLHEKHEHVLHDLATNLGRGQIGKQLQYTLPTDDGTSFTDISESEAAIFKEDMHVLYCDNPYRTDWADLNKPEEQERLFFKGGTLSWQAYYDYGPDHFYDARDLLVTILKRIKTDFVDEFQSGTIKLYHAPGAGGTTLGQKVLWELHESTPCLQIRSDTSSDVKDIAENIEIIYRKKNRPVVVMLDGPDDKLFDQLRRHLKIITVIFLLLKRVSDHMDTRHFDRTQFLLPGTLSPNEAKRICPKFCRFCDNNKKKDQIQTLLDEVVAGKKHHLIEFGLVTYLGEYTGVAAFVAGYLRLNQQNKELEIFQKVLGYLSLVHFFGHAAMSIQFFSKMLENLPDKKVSFRQLPQNVREFVVMEDCRQNSIRICHFLIAKEILEQILSREQVNTKGQDLSDEAKLKLQPFALQFIYDLKSRQVDIGVKSRAVFEIILQTFIQRENLMNEADNPIRNHPARFSRLIESIPSKQPFTERLEVFEAIANSFPENPSFWAHLGRAFALLRLHEKEKIEGFFQKAFGLCHNEEATEVQSTSESYDEHEQDDTVLSFIHHMYGIFYLAKINQRIKECKSLRSEMQFQEEIRKLTKDAAIGCRAFEDSTRYSYAGYQESFGRMGEISIRLQICSFLKTHYRFTTIQELLDKSKNADIWSFVKESLPKIQQLFVQCHNVVDAADADAAFYAKVQQYNEIFKGMVPATDIEHIKVPDTIETRREVLAAIKIKYGKDNHLGTVDDISDESDVSHVVYLLERNLNEYGRGTRHTSSRMSFDFEFLDWIYAIRHPKQQKIYSVEYVLTQVRHWNTLLHSPYSTFYLFILLSVYGINQNAIQYLEEAMILKSTEKFKYLNKKIPNSRTPKEWLATEYGIRRLQPGKNFQRMESLDIVDDDTAVERLQLVKGTIRYPNKLRQKGYIDLDIEANTDVPVHVFFHPSRTEHQLVGTHNAGVRVEFMLAFTVQNGLEGYNVKKLAKLRCINCELMTEIFSNERARKCRFC
ncbi:uncharacterized protein LOC110461772 isoform X3 [Mizuhopecten yessoensis]|uniref:uncharacterized protein LOC110461772 isoform X3 n=1 Tax=Mizuhopecten yessoensis TaxID=6573 RepID=UPI000B45EC88|nr:uncharacterized protein LOC110461772 isoform X3 [Mizuhopecten yessoensis]